VSRLVIKFGGSSVGDINNFHSSEHLHNIATTIKSHIENGHEVVVVVSAMAGATRELKDMAMKINSLSNTLEDDLILTTGEQITVGLLCKLLNSEEFNIQSQSFLGWQLPIITDSEFGNATIKKIAPDKILNCLQNNIVPVIAGYQGITEDNQITTLGFDGSDTTAVAIATAINADACQFYKDVRGIYTANPRRVAKSTKLDEISTNEMYILSSLGARILHPNSLKTALDSNLTIRILPNFLKSDTGTKICHSIAHKKIAGITYFEHEKNRISISVVGEGLKPSDKDLMIKALNKNKIFAEFASTPFDHMSTTVEIGWIEQLDVALASIHNAFGLDTSDQISAPAFIGVGKQIYKDPAVKF
jgi:aspartate kinase